MESATVHSAMKFVFYQLLRNALWHRGEVPKEIEVETFAGLWQMAREQCVAALVSEAMIRNNVKTNAEFTMKLLVEQQKHHKTYEMLQRALSKLTHVLNEEGVDYVVFKGQTLAQFYPIPAFRTPGDIDFYVPKKDFDRVFQILTDSLHIKQANEGTEKHTNFYIDGIDCEMHHRLETFGSSKHQRYFDHLIDADVANAKTIEVGGVRVKTLSATENILLVFKHLYNHMIVEGVGLRQICDLAILLDCSHGQYNATVLKRHLKSIGYWKAFRAMCALMVNDLGLDENKCPFKPNSMDYWWAKRIKYEVEKRGNFGRFNRKTSKPGMTKSMESAFISFAHFVKFFPLSPTEILCLIPTRIKITLNKYKN